MFLLNTFRRMIDGRASVRHPNARRSITPELHSKRRRQKLSLVVEQLETRMCPSPFTVIASGLNNPRGLTFGPDGNLYVAEGGLGGAMSTVGQCDQVPFPIGPYTGGFTSRISEINVATGARTTLVDGLPSSQTNAVAGSLVSGVSDVKFIGTSLYGLEAGAGSSHGLAGTDNTIFRVNPDGTITTIADLSAFQKANPVAHPEPDDFEPDGTWYSMVTVRGSLYAVEPNHGEIDKITTSGQIYRLIDISATQGHVVPTALAFHGNFYVGNLGTFPITPGTQNIYKVTPSGQIQVAASGLTTVLGVAFDAQGQMYALESDTVPGFPGPQAFGSGKVVRVNDDGSLTVITSGLSFPTAMTFGPDGNLYISNIGFGAPPIGLGQIVRVDMPGVASALRALSLSDFRIYDRIPMADALFGSPSIASLSFKQYAQSTSSVFGQLFEVSKAPEDVPFVSHSVSAQPDGLMVNFTGNLHLDDLSIMHLNDFWSSME